MQEPSAPHPVDLPAPAQPAVLVVDDQPINVKLLKRKLERENINVQAAYSGQECLDAVAGQKPNLILLDIMMPGMDGIEVCRRLKENEETRMIPILFITAKSSKEGKLAGLGVGAADYITKPIDLDETLARVNTQLRIQEMYRQTLDLQQRLADSRQAAAIGAVTEGIAHNLNNLLGVVVGYLDLIKSSYDNNPEMVKRSAGLMDKAIQRIVTIVRQLSSIATKEQIKLTPLDLPRLLENSVQRFKSEYGAEADVTISQADPGIILKTNAEIFESIMGRLLINAWESYSNENEQAREIWIDVGKIERENLPYAQIAVNDRGVGIDPRIRDQIYDPFITSRTTVGRGMGLTIARHSIRSMGGDLFHEALPDGGTAAILLHPIS